jgi:glycerate 2-kinase
MPVPRALASPTSLKGVLAARDAAAALEDGFVHVGVDCDQLPLADGGEGTIDALCDEWDDLPARDAFGRRRIARVGRRDDGIVVEAAQVIPFDPSGHDVMHASSRGLGELLAQLRPAGPLVIGIGGTATMDGGAGMLEVLDRLPAETTVLCDVQTTLYDAPRLFGPQKGATAAEVVELERRLRARADLAPYAELPGAGAAGGLGAALASLGAELVPGAAAVVELAGFDPQPYGLVITGEGRVDLTTAEGKAPAEVVLRCSVAGVPCVVFGGIVEELMPGAETIALSGDPARAARDLFELGLRLGTRLLDAAG